MYNKKKLTFNLLLLFSAVFFVTTKLIRNFLPEPISLYSEGRSEKIEMLKRLGPSSNVVVLGNSHVGTSFDPRVFDNESKKKGFDLRSINLAIAGGNHGESIHLAKKFMQIRNEILASQEHQLIILEITNGVNFPPIARHTTREINTFDYETTKLTLSLKSLDANYTINSIGQKVIALGSFILNSLNTGMLSNRIFLNKKFEIKNFEKLLENDKRGYHESMKKINKINATNFLENEDSHIKTDKFLSINNDKLIEALLEEKNSKDFRFGFIAIPLLENKKDKECVKYPEKIVVRNRVIPIFNFTCLKKNPELFQTDNWSDPGHLNYFGAQKISALLAKEVTEWLKKDLTNAIY